MSILLLFLICDVVVFDLITTKLRCLRFVFESVTYNIYDLLKSDSELHNDWLWLIGHGSLQGVVMPLNEQKVKKMALVLTLKCPCWKEYNTKTDLHGKRKLLQSTLLLHSLLVKKK